AIGVAVLLELARIISQRTERKHTVRLISCGAEEQLSEGSAAYVREHRNEVSSNGICVFNFDAFGSHLGWYQLMANGTNDFTSFLSSQLAEADLYAKITNEVFPYGDHFPFTAAGISGCMLLRHNCNSGRFFHHRHDDDMTKISFADTARITDAFAGMVCNLISQRAIPFKSKIPEDQMRKIEAVWNDLFGGW
ncbi:MAG: Zn-dependent exopeptidase M28, partial [Lentisphaerae bacterium]|nr:Zn-dependent exopeptidase M28 [Lentisphaerota bacterium]